MGEHVARDGQPVFDGGSDSQSEGVRIVVEGEILVEGVRVEILLVVFLFEVVLFGDVLEDYFLKLGIK